MKAHDSIALDFREYSHAQMQEQAEAFHTDQSHRRTVRNFSSRPVPRDLALQCMATGILIASLHHAGFAALTHTPGLMTFQNALTGRPGDERSFLLRVAGYPAEGCPVPDIQRKSLGEIVTVL